MKDKSYGICPFKIQDRKIFILMNKTSSISDWNFFKGKIEDGETIKETAEREFFEEAGVKIKIKNEPYFFSRLKKKDIGIFLYSYNNEVFRYEKREIYLADWVYINEIKVSKNQEKILNDLILYFKPKMKYINYIMK
jgi:8-oxo-dGTP pyrophosphatase MutT (NUDIX family)